MLADFADDEIRQPSSRKKINETRTLYQSRQFRRPFRGKSFGLPILCDFGEARIGKTHQTGPLYSLISIELRRSYLRWLGKRRRYLESGDSGEGHHLFGDIFDSNGNHHPFKHLALMVALIGPPPADFVKRSETTGQCFDHNGKRRYLRVSLLSIGSHFLS